MSVECMGVTEASTGPTMGEAPEARETAVLSIWVRAEPAAAGDSATCGGLHGRWRVKLYQGVLAALNSELLHAVSQGPGLQPQPDGRAFASFDDPISPA